MFETIISSSIRKMASRSACLLPSLLTLIFLASCGVPTIDDGAGADAGVDGDGEGAIGAQRRCVPSNNPYSCRPATDGKFAPRMTSPEGTIFWKLAAPTKLYDGFGHARGLVTDSRGIKINYGMRKAINGISMVYAFSVVTDTGTLSGWIVEDALARADLLRQRMPTVQMPNPQKGLYETVWIVTGGDVAKYAGFKVQKKFTGNNRAVTDYLRRPGDVVNIAYNVPGNGLGGFNTDTIPVGTEFHRAKGVLQVSQPYYRAGQSSVRGHVQFVYGFFWDGAQARFGWIAKQAIAPKGTVGPIAPNPAEPSAPNPFDVATAGTWAGFGQCGVRCCDDSLANFVSHGDGECRSSYNTCADHGKTKRMRYNDDLVYTRSSSCN